MAKCFITKLQGTIDNDYLFTQQELRIKCVGNTSIRLSFKEEKTISIIGNGEFTNSTYEDSLGKEMKLTGEKTVFLKGGTFYLSIPDRRDVFVISISRTSSNFEEITNNGFSALKGCSNLENLELEGCGFFKDDLKNLSSLKRLYNLNIAGADISGDISSLSTCQNLNSVSAIGCGNIKGDIASLNALNITFFHGRQTNVSGDISNVGKKFKFISLKTGTWKTERDPELPFLSMEDINFGDDLDKMLIDMARNVNHGSNHIYVSGNRTSESDSAITTLQNNGCTVSIK